MLHSGLDVTLVGLDVANADAVSKQDLYTLTHETNVRGDRRPIALFLNRRESH